MINYKINNLNWTDYYEPFNLSGYKFGDHNISYRANDIVGNVGEIKTLHVELVDIAVESITTWSCKIPY